MPQADVDSGYLFANSFLPRSTCQTSNKPIIHRLPDDPKDGEWV
jgi:hypothetical protein